MSGPAGLSLPHVCRWACGTRRTLRAAGQTARLPRARVPAPPRRPGRRFAAVNCDQTVSRVSRGPLRGDGLRPPVLTDSLLTPGTRPGYNALSRCAELVRALAWGRVDPASWRGAG